MEKGRWKEECAQVTRCVCALVLTMKGAVEDVERLVALCQTFAVDMILSVILCLILCGGCSCDGCDGDGNDDGGGMP